jgi:hypothetical protein
MSSSYATNTKLKLRNVESLKGTKSNSMEAAIPSYLSLSKVINRTRRTMVIHVDGKKAKEQFALEWASGDDSSNEFSIFMLSYFPRGREKLQKLILDHMSQCFEGPGLSLLVEQIAITLRGAHMGIYGFIPYLTVPIAKRIEDIETVIAEMPARNEDFDGNKERALIEKHRLDTKNFNGIIDQDDIQDRNELQKYVDTLRDMEKKWTLDELSTKRQVYSKKRRV